MVAKSSLSRRSVILAVCPALVLGVGTVMFGKATVRGISAFPFVAPADECWRGAQITRVVVDCLFT